MLHLVQYCIFPREKYDIWSVMPFFIAPMRFSLPLSLKYDIKLKFSFFGPFISLRSGKLGFCFFLLTVSGAFSLINSYMNTFGDMNTLSGIYYF
jgi:hypothetical protein